MRSCAPAGSGSTCRSVSPRSPRATSRRRSGKCEFASESTLRDGGSLLPEFIPPRESALADPALAARFPLMLLTPPARHYLNSSFSSIESLVRDTGEPWVEIHPADAAARGIASGDRVRVHNDRGAFR